MSKRYGTRGDLLRTAVDLGLSTEPVQAWKESASCRSFPDDLWYSDNTYAALQAKRICNRCPVQNECLSAAIENREPWGIWGGLTVKERFTLYPRDDRQVAVRDFHCQFCGVHFTSTAHQVKYCEKHRTTKKRAAA